MTSPAMSTASTARRRPRALVAVLLSLLTVLLTIPACSARAIGPLTDVSLIVDEAKVLDDEALVSAINALASDKDYRIAVVTTSSTEVYGTGTVFHDSLKDHLRREKSLLVDKDGDEVRVEDGLVVLAFVPQVGQVEVLAAPDVQLEPYSAEQVKSSASASIVGEEPDYDAGALAGARQVVSDSGIARQTPVASTPEEGGTSGILVPVLIVLALLGAAVLWAALRH